MNIATFGPLASLERNGEEIESLDDIAGLRQRHPGLAAALAVGAGSLIGLPPLLGFWAKLYLFAAGIEKGQTVLVVIAAVNSGISVYYYLKLLSEPLVAPTTPRSETVSTTASIWPRVATAVTAVLLVVLPVFLAPTIAAANRATQTTERTVEPAGDALGAGVAPAADRQDAASEATSVPLASALP
jgi:NADH-quinone oxidoreductase subunit N